MEPIHIAYFGSPGSYTWEAAKKWFAGKNTRETGCALFEEVVELAAKERVDYGVLPIENTSTGSITEVYDLIKNYHAAIVGETCIKIEHHLLGLPGASLAEIRTVYSHPQAFAQCRNFFKDKETMRQIPHFNTSRSAKKVKEAQDRTQAAVGSRPAAELYGLEILADNIHTNDWNYTRFFVIAGTCKPEPDADKISLMLTLSHTSGSLYGALQHLAEEGLNLTHLESRPMEGRPFEYVFHIDVMGNLGEKKVQAALQKLKAQSLDVRILGNYRAYKGEFACGLD